MRILWLSHFFPYPPAGGALQRSYHLLRHVASRHDVDLVSLSKSRDRPGYDQAGAEYPVPGELCRQVSIFEIPAERSWFHRVGLVLKGPLSGKAYDVRWLQSRELSDFLSSLADRRPRYDLVHVDTIGLMQYRDVLPLDRIVLNHHNVESHMMRRRANNEKNWAVGWYLKNEARKLRRLEAEACRRCTTNLVVSHLEEVRLKEVAEDARVDVVPNGVDVDYFRPRDLGKTQGQDGLVFVGRLSWYPNEDAMEWFLDEIWPLLVHAKDNRRITVVGDSPPSALRNYSGPGTVETTGFVPDVRPYMNRAQIYVCPIRTGGGTRLKILDAMAMGMPIVATSMSVEGLGLSERQHFLRADSPVEFVEAINELEEDTVLRETLAVQARKEASRRFSWSVIGKKLEDAYRHTLSA